jgi:hypothetical protein
MTLAALQHILRAARILAEDRRFLVLGSASLLASLPGLGDADGLLAATYDADLCPQPFDELTAVMLDESLGESRVFFQRHGYHADILRESILETLPEGWRGRLVPVPECPDAYALDPEDLAAVKLSVGRPKEIELVRKLLAMGMIDPIILRLRIEGINLPIERLPRVLANLGNATHG